MNNRKKDTKVKRKTPEKTSKDKRLVNVMGKRAPFIRSWGKNSHGFGHSRGR